MIGKITKIYRNNDTGNRTAWVDGENGEVFFLAPEDMIGKQKHYKEGCMVKFDPAESGKNHRKAVNASLVSE